MKKNILVLLGVLVLFTVLVLIFKSLLGIRISEKNFPSWELMSSVRRYDVNKNGYLSKKELEDAKTLCVDCSNLSGIEQLTNLQSLILYNQCPDLSIIEQLTNLEEIEIENCEFNETFVFDNEIPVTNVIFRSCYFEKGVLFKNNSVEYVEFGECGVNGDVVFADCDGLTEFRAEFDVTDLNFDSDYPKELNCNIDLSGCDNLDWLLVSSEKEQILTSVDLSNCSKLRSFSIYDFDHYDINTELTLNISGCPNIKEAHIPAKRVQELDISDCPYLISASEQTPSEEDFLGLRYETDDGYYILTGNENLVFIK